MENKLSKLIKLVQSLPESCLDEAIQEVEKLINKTTEIDSEEQPPPCPHCRSGSKKNGHKDGTQRYKCKSCNKTYGETTNTAMYHSHCGEAAWKQVIRDTVDGVPLEKTAESLALHISTAFNMRHKILLALEAEEKLNPTVLDGVCELDDTYVLESLKGTKITDDYWRGPRKHGAVAQKRGLSNEYICISAGVQRDGDSYSQTVTRSAPSKLDLEMAFNGHIGDAALIMCDGDKSYNALNERFKSTVINVSEENRGGFTHINTVNNFHRLIKDRYNNYRGVATKYLNRYNALFSILFRSGADLADKIYEILRPKNIQRHHNINDVKSLNLLDI
jgi:transposase-like protein